MNHAGFIDTNGTPTRKAWNILLLKAKQKPCFSKGKELWFCDHLVLRVERKAKNLCAVLEAFQQNGWPNMVEDVKNGDGESLCDDRIRETVRGLNEKLRETECGMHDKRESEVLRFFSNGHGTGVIWKLVPQSDA